MVAYASINTCQSPKPLSRTIILIPRYQKMIKMVIRRSQLSLTGLPMPLMLRLGIGQSTLSTPVPVSANTRPESSCKALWLVSITYVLSGPPRSLSLGLRISISHAWNIQGIYILDLDFLRNWNLSFRAASGKRSTFWMTLYQKASTSFFRISWKSSISNQAHLHRQERSSCEPQTTTQHDPTRRMGLSRSLGPFATSSHQLCQSD